MPAPTVKYEIVAEDKSKKTIGGVEANLARMAKVGVASIAAAATASAAALATLTKDAAKAADEIGKVATQLGLSERSLSALKFIAGQTGVEFNTLTQALQRSNRRIAEAALGTGEAQEALKELNLDAQRLSQLAPDQQFAAIAKQLAAIDDSGDQVRLAFKLFDSEGVRLLRTIKETGGEFGALRSRAEELGVVVDKSLTTKAAQVNDAWEEAGQALGGVGNSLLSTFAPTIVAIANTVTSLIVKALDLAEAFGFVEAQANAQGLAIVTSQIAEKQEQLARAMERSNGLGRMGNAAQLEVNRLNAELIPLLERQAEIKQAIAESNQELALSEKNIAEVVAAGVDPFGGGDAVATGSNPEFDRLLESLQTEEEAIRASYQNRLQIIEENTRLGSQIRAELIDKENKRLETAILQHQARLGKAEAISILKRRAFEEKNTREKSIFILNELASLTSGVAQNSRTMFEINKAAAIATAIVSGIQGVARTLGEYPYPINIGMAALHAVAAAAQVNAARSATYSGGGGGTTPSLAGSAPTVNSIPITNTESPVVPSTPFSSEPIAGSLNANRVRPVINIDFSGGLTTTQAVREFIENELAEALRDGVGIDVDVRNVS